MDVLVINIQKMTIVKVVTYFKGP